MARQRKSRTKRPPRQPELPLAAFDDASLSEETRRRYLSYALSVITSRALPDVRDGLKPVQRRILYTMFNELRLRSDARYRKSAAIVGDVMGKFHPHGDSSIYDAQARMAQSFTMAVPLVDGRGNFGSPDGDAPAAMRYTEAKLQPIADELLVELGKQTVAFRPTYDGTRFEPVVLPARFPNLLVNGSQGIAVGMATSIPPHNLSEVLRAAIALIDDPDITLARLMQHIKGPDFPTGGELISTKRELRAAYETGQGTLKLRSEWAMERGERGHEQIVITSGPYGVERRVLVEKIAEVVLSKKLPPLLDVRDESTEECRIVCEIKKGTDPRLVMAYLFKHTPLQTNVGVNLTCLVPTRDYVDARRAPGDADPLDGSELAAPRRLSLPEILRHFVDFRMEVVTRRLEHELAKLRERIHILEGFVTVFDALDETIRIIRRSEGKQDAAKKLIKRFELDAEQVDAILELKLYRLARLQILVIREELEEKAAQAAVIDRQLDSKAERWGLIREELEALRAAHPTPRRTKIVTELDEPEFEAEAFIVEEDAIVVLTRQGWVKRQGSMKSLQATRVREGDAVLDVVGGSTRASVAFFSNQGVCYVTRIVDVPPTTGYGTPVQRLFKLGEGEQIVAVMSFDERFLNVPPPEDDSTMVSPPFALAVTRGGMALQFSLRNHRDPSTRAGRKFARLKPDDQVLYVGHVEEGDRVACVSAERRALICAEGDITLLAGPGRGVTLLKLAPDDYLVGARLLRRDSDALVVTREGGAEYRVTTRKYDVVSRGGKGHVLFKRGGIESVVAPEPELPSFPSE